MTEKQIAYRKFLDSPFWKNLTKTKIELSGKRCSHCNADQRLQSHHIRYPDNWYDTTLLDLQVLCRDCHSAVHDRPVKSKVWTPTKKQKRARNKLRREAIRNEYYHPLYKH